MFKKKLKKQVFLAVRANGARNLDTILEIYNRNAHEVWSFFNSLNSFF